MPQGIKTAALGVQAASFSIRLFTLAKLSVHFNKVTMIKIGRSELTRAFLWPQNAEQQHSL